MSKLRQYLKAIYRYRTNQFLKSWLKGYESLFKDKIGLEVGGPSGLFRSGEPLAIYRLCRQMDGCNFSSYTIWEGDIRVGDYVYEAGKPIGHQYICEADDLSAIESDKYDFLVACHSLEHVANPIKALHDWRRVLKHDGTLLIIVPEKRFTFDHNRPYTTMAHLIDDYSKNVNETDLTHLDEILLLHDYQMDKGVVDYEQFKSRSLNNYENRGLHHHVYNLETLKELVTFTGFKFENSFFFNPINNLILVKKQ